MRTEVYDLNGSKISIPIAESYKDCMTIIKSDRHRISGKVETSLSIIVRSLTFSSSLLFWLRLSQYKGWLNPLCRIMYARASRKAHVQISATIDWLWLLYWPQFMHGYQWWNYYRKQC